MALYIIVSPQQRDIIFALFIFVLYTCCFCSSFSASLNFAFLYAAFFALYLCSMQFVKLCRLPNRTRHPRLWQKRSTPPSLYLSIYIYSSVCSLHPLCIKRLLQIITLFCTVDTNVADDLLMCADTSRATLICFLSRKSSQCQCDHRPLTRLRQTDYLRTDMALS